VRIIGGRLKGRSVKVPDRKGLRPTSARVREAVFHRLLTRLEGADVLDVFAGSGVLAFEALSRGAARAVCVERDSVAARTIHDTARGLGVEVEVRRRDARRAGKDQFDVVLADPPYDDDPAVWASRLAKNVRADGVLVMEHRSGALHPRSLRGLSVEWQRRYGDSEVTFLLPQA